MLRHTPSPRTVALLGLLALCAGAAGCATAGRGGASKQEVVWPLPPDKPRVRWIRSIKAEESFEAGFGRKLMRLFVPAPKDAVIMQPSGLALSRDGRRLVVVCNNARILEVDLEQGSLALIADQEGKRPLAPFAAAMDDDDNLYVTDMRAKAVWVYDRKGAFLLKLTSDKLERPTGIAIDGRRQLLYVTNGVGTDSPHHRVEVFTLQGKHLRTIGTRGVDPGNFNFPTNLAVAKDGSLFVVDTLNFRIQQFDPEGRLVGTFGQIGAGEYGTFDKAKGLTFDAFGNIYVTDSQTAGVQIFNSKFQPLMGFSGRGTDPGNMLLPTAIVIDQKNTIYVADFALGAVHQFELINTGASDSFLAPAAEEAAGAAKGAGATPAPPPPR